MAVHPSSQPHPPTSLKRRVADPLFLWVKTIILEGFTRESSASLRCFGSTRSFAPARCIALRITARQFTRDICSSVSNLLLIYSENLTQIVVTGQWRVSGQRIRKPSLYPAELRDRFGRCITAGRAGPTGGVLGDGWQRIGSNLESPSAARAKKPKHLADFSETHVHRLDRS